MTTLNTFDDEDDAGPDEPARRRRPAGGTSGAKFRWRGVAPSQAGRVDTHAAETDPTIKGPEGAPKTHPAAEEATSVDLTEGRTAGSTGGTRQGPTDAASTDAAAEQKKAETTGGQARTDGPLKAKGAAAEDAVVQEHKRVDDKGRPSLASGTEDLSGKDQTATGTLEGQRTDTDDVTPGPDVGKGAPAKGRRGTKPKASE